MIEVFKTNVYKYEIANKIILKLAEYFPENKINFDLDDCDKILRIEGHEIIAPKIKDLLNEEGFECEMLD